MQDFLALVPVFCALAHAGETFSLGCFPVENIVFPLELQWQRFLQEICFLYR